MFGNNCFNGTGDPEAEDINVRTIDILNDIFGKVIDEDTIKAVVLSCNGHLTPSMENLMKMTNYNQLKVNGDTVSLNTNPISTSFESNQQDISLPSNSMSSLSYNAAAKSNVKKLNTETPHHIFVPQNQSKQMFSKNPVVNKIIEDIKNDYKILILLRGLPGSGKTTLAKNIISPLRNESNNHIFSTDDYYSLTGKYKYNRNLIGEAHEWNQNRVLKKLNEGLSPIFIDNTNTEIWEMQIYVVNGVKNGYIIEVLEADTPWANNIRELARKNVHNVPADKLRRMNERFLRDITGDYLLRYFKLTYPPNKNPPQQIKHQSLPKNNALNGFEDVVDNKLNLDTSFQNFYIAEHSPNRGLQKIGLNSPTIISSPMNNSTTGNYNNTASNASYFLTHSKSAPLVSDKGYNLQRLNSDDQKLDTKIDVSCFTPKPQRIIAGNRRTGLFENDTLFNIEWKDMNDSDWKHEKEQSPGVSPDTNEWNDVSTETLYLDHSTQCFDGNPESFGNFKTLTAISREINISSNTKQNTHILSKKSTLDKSTITIDEELFVPHESRKEQLKQLKMLFDYIPNDHLIDILDRCNGDLNWAGEILLDSNIDPNVINLNNSSEANNVTSDSSDNDENAEVKSIYPSIEAFQNTLDSIENFEPPVSKKEKSLEQHTSIRRHIEENFVMNESHYSEHVLKLRRRIHGEISPPLITFEEHENKVISIPNEEAGPSKVTGSSDEDYNEDDDDEKEPVVSLRVGMEFIEHLNLLYDTPTYETELEPIIHMPVSLMTQIHALWMESVCNQLDVQRENMKVIVKEDEEFARALEAKEREELEVGAGPEVPNLRDIMQMELDLERYNAANSEWQNESPDDMASRLTKKKLIEMFPNLEEKTLMEILHAYHYNYTDAFQDLLLSTGAVKQTQINGLEPQELKSILAQQEKNLIERSIQAKNMDLITPIPSTSTDDHVTIEERKTLVTEYRKEAQQYLSMRNSHRAKAEEYFRRKLYGPANYYSNLANLYSKKHDYVNNLAASEIIQVNTAGKDEFTLDLHSLYVPEAVQAMNMFFDKHICILREKVKRPCSIRVFLITGRGLHSPGNYARVKIAAKSHLKLRKLRYYEANPGLLGVHISSTDLLSDSYEKSNLD